MNISQTKEQIKALSAFQNNCEMESIDLQLCNATRAKTGTTFKAPFSAKPTVSNVSSSLSGRRFVVELAFEYSAWDSSDTPERLFQVNCTFEVAYRLNESYTPSEEEKTSFSRGTALFNCWPYAREFFRDMTTRLGHAAPTLPLLRITPKKPDTESILETKGLPPTPESTNSEAAGGSQPV